LAGNQISTTGVSLLTQSPLFGQLTDLGLSSNFIDDGGFAILASSPRMQLARLDMGNNVIHLSNVRRMALLARLQDLTSLNLSNNRLHLPGPIGKVLAGVGWSRLTHLDLDSTGFDDKGVRALAEAPQLSRLRTLSLCGNEISVAGVTALAASPYLGGLRRLGLNHNPCSLSDAATLMARFGKAVCLY
jgi:hypothetical protein